MLQPPLVKRLQTFLKASVREVDISSSALKNETKKNYFTKKAQMYPEYNVTLRSNLLKENKSGQQNDTQICYDSFTTISKTFLDAN